MRPHYPVVGAAVAVAVAHPARYVDVDHVRQLVPGVVVVHQGVSSVANLRLFFFPGHPEKVPPRELSFHKTMTNERTNLLLYGSITTYSDTWYA